MDFFPNDEVHPARWVAFGRALLRGHYAMVDGRCACGHWQGVCPVRVLARQHGVPADPDIGNGALRISPAVR